MKKYLKKIFEECFKSKIFLREFRNADFVTLFRNDFPYHIFKILPQKNFASSSLQFFKVF